MGFTAATGSPPLLGFQYFGIQASGNPSTQTFSLAHMDALGAFWTMLTAIEFLPGANFNGAFDPATEVSRYNFTNFVVQNCANTTDATTGIMTMTIKFVDSNNWIITCRFASGSTTDSNSNLLSPTNAKCDLTFGNYPYKQNDTYVGLFTVFVVSGFDATATITPEVKPCGNDGATFCLVSANSAYAGQFSWVKKLKNNKTVFATGINVFAAEAGQFQTPAAPTSVGSGNSTATVNVKAFQAASFALFSTFQPQAGDIWDPTLSMVKTTPTTPPSSSTSVTFSLLLIIACLLRLFI